MQQQPDKAISAVEGPLIAPVKSDSALPQRADVVVIGGGIVGVAAAYFLAKKGISVALLEKGQVAGEQSSRNWGWCRQQNCDERELPLMKESMALWVAHAEAGADLGFRRTGLIYVTKDPKELATWEGWVNMAQPFQVGSRMLSPAEAREMTRGTRRTGLGVCFRPGMAAQSRPWQRRLWPKRRASAEFDPSELRGAWDRNHGRPRFRRCD